MSKVVLFLVIYFLVLNIYPAYAYIGPGLGVGILAIIIGFIFAICVALFTVIYFPIKKIIIKLNKNKNKNK